MADNFLEKRYQDYEARKAEWLRRKKHKKKVVQRRIIKPEDESL
ncbi:dehydrogenase [Prevotella ihumii]|nr:dehydrogenase [Prevotella ihumii]